ncbi:hypothetical protein SESBI_32996 [Sesbania bispinosa]|nr:hypothetical protein SESBI_32996 [Sesbania bispinosa]
MHRPVVPSATPRGGMPTDSGDSVVTLDQVPCWSDTDQSLGNANGDSSFSSSYFPDPLASPSGADGGDGSVTVSRFPVDREINSKIYLWRGNPWNLEVDAVVNSTNELDCESTSQTEKEGSQAKSNSLIVVVTEQGRSTGARQEMGRLKVAKQRRSCVAEGGGRRLLGFT